jgi:hypothetical protein
VPAGYPLETPSIGQHRIRSKEPRSLRMHVLGSDVTNVLAECPHVALRVLGPIGAIAVELIGKRSDHVRALCLRHLMVLVDVIDVHVDQLGATATVLRGSGSQGQGCPTSPRHHRT